MGDSFSRSGQTVTPPGSGRAVTPRRVTVQDPQLSQSNVTVARSTTVTHEPIDADRHAGIVADLCRNNPRAWSALYSPGNYVYDQRDQVRGADLDLRCTDLRLAFGKVTDWEVAMYTLTQLLRLDQLRRRISIGVRIDGRTIYGEAA